MEAEINTTLSQETQSQRSVRYEIIIVIGGGDGRRRSFKSDVTDTWIGTVHRKRSCVSKDDMDSTMAGDFDDPYDFTEDENSQRFLSHANMTTQTVSIIFTLTHVAVCLIKLLILSFTIAQPSQPTRPVSQRSSQRKKTDISQDRLGFVTFLLTRVCLFVCLF